MSDGRRYCRIEHVTQPARDARGKQHDFNMGRCATYEVTCKVEFVLQ